PSCLIHCDKVTSEMDSPTVGTFISKLIYDSFISWLIYFGSGFYALFHFFFHLCSSFVFECATYHGELLGNVLLGISGGCTTAFLTGYDIQCDVPIPEFPADVGPGAHVFRLFLHPQELTGIFILVANGTKFIHRGGV